MQILFILYFSSFRGILFVLGSPFFENAIIAVGLYYYESMNTSFYTHSQIILPIFFGSLPRED